MHHHQILGEFIPLGMNVRFTPCYHFSEGYLGVQVNWNQIMATHISHSSYVKDTFENISVSDETLLNIHPKDGWYGDTGSHFSFGLEGAWESETFVQDVIKIRNQKRKIHMIQDIFFCIGLSLFFVHEMDAVRRNEWKMFIFLSKLKPEMGYIVFSFLHVPFFILIFWGLFSANQGLRNDFIMFLNLFFIIHFFLHLTFIRHHNNEFKSAFSWFIISGMFLMGMFNLWV